MAERLRVGVIGCGGIARSHLKALRALEGIEVAATADALPERARAYAEEYGARRWYGSSEALLADPDVQAVHICLPHDAHHPVGLAALRAGKHVLMEKPLALSMAQAVELVETAEARGVVLMVGHVLRFRTANREARRLIREGRLGQVRNVIRRRMSCVDHTKLPAWHADPRQIGNFCIYGFGTHEVDIILWILDTEARRVYACGRVVNPVWGNQDEAAALLELKNGAMASYVQSMNVRQSAYDCLFVGTEGSMRLTHEAIDINGEVRPMAPQADGGMTEQIEEFARACREGRPPESSGRDCLRTQRALDAMWESVQTGRVVEV